MDLIKWFIAQFPGRCKACDVPFGMGDDIGHLDDEIVGYDCCRGLGSDGREGLSRGTVPEEACDKCFLVHSTNQGECE